MSRTFTVQQVIDLVRSIGCYENLDGDYSGDAPSAPSSGTLLRFIDRANRYAWEQWSAADAGWNLTYATATMVPSLGSYPLPTDCHRLTSVEISLGGQGFDGFVPLERATQDDDSWSSDSFDGSTPHAYRVMPDSITLLPAPGSAYVLRLGYTPVAPSITDPTQEIAGTDGYDDVVVYRTLVQCRQREEKDTREFASAAAEAIANFRQSIRRRDRANPIRMRPWGPGVRRRLRW